MRPWGRTGPSTPRATLGRVVDVSLNPLRHVGSSSDRQAVTAIGITSRLGDRYRYSDTIESILYESEDSYAQARILYLQNRRFELRGDAEPEYFDPYEDPYEEPYADPIILE
jgi:phospholipid-binding lipoprotein MlaA